MSALLIFAGKQFSFSDLFKKYLLNVNYVPDIIDESQQERGRGCPPGAFGLAGKGA